MYTVILELEEAIPVDSLLALIHLDCAWVHGCEGPQHIRDLVFKLWERVEHLNSSLRHAHITDLFSSLLVYEFEICHRVVGSHFSPAEGPVLWIVHSQRIVALAVLCAAIVGDIDIEAAIKELEKHVLLVFAW